MCAMRLTVRICVQAFPLTEKLQSFIKIIYFPAGVVCPEPRIPENCSYSFC